MSEEKKNPVEQQKNADKALEDKKFSEKELSEKELSEEECNAVSGGTGFGEFKRDCRRG